jgi:flagellar biosynthesis protein FlhA
VSQTIAIRPGVALVGLGAPVLLLAMLSMIALPLPPLALDLLFTFNIALAMIVLLATVYSARPLDFGIFPTVLLVATLLRLALNIASTRVVLLEGHAGAGAAGQVIEAFGAFVVGGNYAVGLIVFAILVIINFVVVTKGAGRVSEVTARFTLDAMPGKQMAIDADLNAGVLSQEEARERREEIGRESDFYGAMDGASKFVRGDAIAGLLIVFINILGGLIVGAAQHGLTIAEAARSYTLLTIGDGLAAQIPSLLLSTATAVIVTRVSSNEDMGQQVAGQLFGDPRALFVTAAVVGLLGLVPGMPNLVFLLLATTLAVFGWLRTRARAEDAAEPAPAAIEAPASEETPDFGWADVAEVDVLGLEVGYRLIPLVDRTQGGELMSRIKGVRKKVSAEMGFLIQPVHIRDDLDLGPNAYRITLNGVAVGESEIYPDRELAINPGQVYGTPDGTATKDPSFGLDAVWIAPMQRDEAQTMGYTVVDPATVVATHLSTLLKRHAHELLGHDDARKLLDRLAESSPQLVEELVPKTMPLATVVRVLRNLLEEDVPIRDIRSIATTLLEHGTRSTDPDALTSAVRQALSRQIGHAINGNKRELPLITFDPALEQVLQSAGPSPGSEAVTLEPALAERVQQALARTAERAEAEGRAPVLVVPPEMRSWVSRWLRPTVQGLHVLSYNEIPDNKQLRIVATLGEDIDGTPSGAASEPTAAGAMGSN